MMTTEERERLANTPTPPAMAGTWTLIAPDGRQWIADSPLKACSMELRERVPSAVSVARILRAAMPESELLDSEGTPLQAAATRLYDAIDEAQRLAVELVELSRGFSNDDT